MIEEQQKLLSLSLCKWFFNFLVRDNLNFTSYLSLE